MSRRESDPVAEQLRRAAASSGRSVTHLAKDAEVDRRQLGRFLRRERKSCYVETAESLALALGYSLELVPLKRPKAKGKAESGG